MSIKTNLVGERFGRLVVIAKTASYKGMRWVCQCDCGKTCVTTGSSLRCGKKKSCNCLRSETCRERAKINSYNKTFKGDEGSFNQLYAVYKWAAAKREFSFELTKEKFRELTSGDCTYCGVSPKQVYVPAKSKIPYVYNGVDRKVNSVGYTVENCVSCCGVCNDMKRTRSVEDFLAACRAVITHTNYKKSAEMTDSDKLSVTF